MILAVALAIYTLGVSVIYALLSFAAPRLADALLILFVAALLLPMAFADIRRWWRGRGD